MWCVCLCVVVCVVWCGVCRVVWHAENPRVYIQNVSVYIQNVPVYAGTTRTFQHVRVVPVHTGTF